jgi:hypothetical protein
LTTCSKPGCDGRHRGRLARILLSQSAMQMLTGRVQWLISCALMAAIVAALVLGALAQQPLGRP